MKILYKNALVACKVLQKMNRKLQAGTPSVSGPPRLGSLTLFPTAKAGKPIFQAILPKH
jgi:hypothetical protein